MSMSKQAVREYFDLKHKAVEAANRGQNQEVQIYLESMKLLRSSGVSSQEIREGYADVIINEVRDNHARKLTEFAKRYNRAFTRYIATGDEKELRAAQEFAPAATGGQSITQTFLEGPAGGYFVSQKFDQTIRDAKIQIDPLADPDVVTVIQEDGPFGGAMNPLSVQGYDLTSVEAVAVGEATLNIDNPNLSGSGTSPVVQAAEVHRAQIGANPTYRCDLAVSLELDEDADQLEKRLAIAASVAHARKAGADVVTTLENAVPSTYETAASGIITIGDLQNIAFQVDRLYRQSPKVGWVMGDDVWGMICKQGSGQSTSSFGVPYIDPLTGVADEILLGFPVQISPSLATSVGASPISNAKIYFGDLSKIVVHKSQLWSKRVLQTGAAIGSVTHGQATYQFRQRVGSTYFDPGQATCPAIVGATLRA